MKKRIINCLVVTALLCSAFNIPVLAATATAASSITNEEMNDILVEHGYTEYSAEGLNDEYKVLIAEMLIEDPSKVDIQTTVMEVDVLAEIEATLSCTDEELQSAGITKDKIDSVTQEIYKMLDMNDEELKKEYSMDDIQIKMLRKAAENAEAIKKGKKEKDTKKIKNPVDASGSITSSEMSYSQTKINQSSSTAPKYLITLSYAWKEVYAMQYFNDEIAVSWGGGYNYKNASTNASYYDWVNVASLGTWKQFVTRENMMIEASPQAGLEFIFPQTSTAVGGIKSKTQCGAAQFTIYQTQFQGYDTSIVSQYAHKIFTFAPAITVSGTGVAPSIYIGTGWDKSAQKSATVSY